jgi:hypothetical protein
LKLKVLRGERERERERGGEGGKRESPSPAALSITITQSSLLGLFAQSSLLGHEQEGFPRAR